MKRRKKKEEDGKDQQSNGKTDSPPDATKRLTFDIEQLKSVTTDFEKEGGFQKAVRFSRDHTLVITGGGDGFLRVWKVRIFS